MEKEADPRAETEKWFVDRGVPHFIESYSGTEDVLTRALPALVLFFLFSSISAIDLDWPVWGIVAASLGGLLILLGVWAGINWLRGIRPLLLAPWRAEGWMYLLAKLALPIHLPVALLKRIRSRKLKRRTLGDLRDLLVGAPPVTVPVLTGGKDAR